MTAPLRPSQIETLRVVGFYGTWGATLDKVAVGLGLTERAAEQRLERLRRDPRRPFIEIVLAGYFPKGPFRFYRLTQLGREALEGRG
jgi:hypothetical protein